MPVNRWRYRVELGHVFRNEEMTFEERRDEIVRGIRESPWFNSHSEGSWLHSLTEELSEVVDEPYFNHVWNCIYDQADIDRCWIETTSIKK